jgi:GABA permease
VSDPDTAALDPHPPEHVSPIARLLVVADYVVADVDELPRRARAVLDAAARVYVVTPNLPGRLNWLANDSDRSRHLADERLDVVLGHMSEMGARASGTTGGDSTMAAVADAVTQFQPDQILVGLRSPEHANWQEHGLIENMKERFGLPLVTFSIDADGHVADPAPEPAPGAIEQGERPSP